MSATALRGGCHCGNLVVDLVLTQPAASYAPRCCDCSFCRKHGAAWLSDARGSLRVVQRDAAAVLRYRQGSGQADCLACARCAVLVLVTCEIEGRLYAAVNARVLDGEPGFASAQSASPQRLVPDDKRSRWQQLWFADVHIEAVDPLA
ncbi:aldehyde-activating protein [Lysobacter koreensis]|uniref:Aldehyde-activating protein n=1 Tax=Lysobacter koreensis TaxID=266122 RepID=A0ABW2YP36_9GAMM